MFKLKCFILLCAIFFSSLSFSRMVEIVDIKPNDLDWSVELISKYSNNKITLDCAGFINNLQIKYKGESYLFYLNEQTCITDMSFLSKLPQERRCLHFDDSGYHIDGCTQ